MTVKWIAERLGAPLAARAVGKAMAGNPVPLIVPCHRVVKKRVQSIIRIVGMIPKVNTTP